MFSLYVDMDHNQKPWAIDLDWETVHIQVVEFFKKYPHEKLRLEDEKGRFLSLVSNL